MVQEFRSPSVASALSEAHVQYVKRNPSSEKLQLESSEHLPGGNTRSILHTNPFPLTFLTGEGATLTSVDGHNYLDFLGEYSAGIFGHSNAQIKEAVTTALSKGWNFGGQCTYEKILAQKVVERFQASGLEHVRFTNSGTEANTMAIVAATCFTGRKKILVFSGGYHGGTLIFPMELMRDRTLPTSNLPHEYVFAPYNNIAATEAIIAHLPTDSIAAILVEPIQGSGGCRPASSEFLHFLRRQADASGAVLIADEVMASRLGPHGYCADAGVRADMVTLGKYIGGGMTFGAFGGRRDIMQLFDPSNSRLQHPGTYNNNVVSMAAGVAGLGIYNSEAVARLNQRGQAMKRALQELLISYGIYRNHPAGALRNIIEVDSFQEPTKIKPDNDGDSAAPLEALPRMFVTGQGSMLNVRFSGEDRAIWQALFYHFMLAHNIYLAPRGYTPLHLALEDGDVDQYVSAVRDFIVAHRAALLV